MLTISFTGIIQRVGAHLFTVVWPEGTCSALRLLGKECHLRTSLPSLERKARCFGILVCFAEGIGTSQL